MSVPTFPQHAADVIDAFLAKPHYAELAKGTDDQRRELTVSIIEQLAFDEPRTGWCWKSADPGRPPSKDGIALQQDSRLYCFDWQSGSSRGRQVQVGQPAEDITGQNAIPVEPHNWLGTEEPPKTDEALAARVTALEQQLLQVVDVAKSLNRSVGQLTNALDTIVAELHRQDSSIVRIDGYLAQRPIPTGVQVSAPFGIRISSRLTFEAPKA